MRCGIGQVDRDLGVLDPPGGAGVLALHAHRAVALLQVTGLVEHQHRVEVAQGSDDVVTQIVADTVGVPARPRQQILHAVRIGLAGVLSDRPAVLPRQVGQQPQHEPPDPPPGLDPGEPSSHPAQQPVGLNVPAVWSYAVARGHRLIF